MSSENTEKHLNILTKAATRLKETVSATTAAISGLFSADFLSGFLISSFKGAVSELREIDRLVTKIGKADKTLSKAALAGIKTNALETSVRYGIKPSDYLDEILEASRSGYKNAEKIAELSTALQLAAGISADAARAIIAAADSAYSLGGSVTKLTGILNGLLNTAGKGALNMEQLSESFSLAAGQAAKLGAGADKTAAATATLISASGLDAQEAAGALTSIISVISGSYQDCLAKGSTSSDRFASACAKLSVSLDETKNGITALRDPVQIINDLADACSRLSGSDTMRTELFDAFEEAGGSQEAADALNALIENRQTYEEMLSSYSGGGADITGDAQKQLESLDAALNRLSGTWTQTIGNISDSKAATALVNTATGLLTAVNGITKSLGTIGTLGLGAGIASGIMNTGKRRASARIS